MVFLQVLFLSIWKLWRRISGGIVEIRCPPRFGLTGCQGSSLLPSGCLQSVWLAHRWLICHEQGLLHPLYGLCTCVCVFVWVEKTDRKVLRCIRGLQDNQSSKQIKKCVCSGVFRQQYHPLEFTFANTHAYKPFTKPFIPLSELSCTKI